MPIVILQSEAIIIARLLRGYRVRAGVKERVS
jgi:hypothetical protein